MTVSIKTALDVFLLSYVETALWSSTDDEDVALDEAYTIDDLAPATLESMREDCDDFLNGIKDLVDGRLYSAGHDFWLTRNRHGAGFWDGAWPEQVGRLLTERSRAYGSCDLYVGDDRLIYLS